jgi:hypothetical protein
MCWRDSVCVSTRGGSQFPSVLLQPLGHLSTLESTSCERPPTMIAHAGGFRSLPRILFAFRGFGAPDTEERANCVRPLSVPRSLRAFPRAACCTKVARDAMRCDSLHRTMFDAAHPRSGLSPAILSPECAEHEGTKARRNPLTTEFSCLRDFVFRAIGVANERSRSLIRSQRDHRIDARRAPRRDEARDEPDRTKHRCGCDNHCRIQC